MRALAFWLPLLAAITGSSALGQLVERDFKTPGDGLLTFDPNTGLEWLDVSETLLEDFPGSLLEDRYQAVVAETEVGGRFEGFWPAEPAAAESLVLNAGIDPSAFDFATNGPQTQLLIGLLGAQDSDPNTGIVSGLTSGVEVSSVNSQGQLWRVALQVRFQTVPGFSQRADAFTYLSYRTEVDLFPVDTSYSVLLVRSVTPEPDGLSIGLLLIASALTWRRAPGALPQGTPRESPERVPGARRVPAGGWGRSRRRSPVASGTFFARS